MRNKNFAFSLPLTLVLCFPTIATSAQRDSERSLVAVVQDRSDYLGFTRCSGCHSGGGSGRLAKDYIQLREFDTWDKKDKHSKAYKALEGKLGKQIGRILGIDVTGDTACLSCHAPLHKDKNVPVDEVKEGITCESCHGPSRKWYIPHSDPEWRTKSPRQKERLGMVDVRNPLKRAKQCFSCHIGNASEGKVVTHEMYSAGHPPLPGIEVEAFLRKMPPHWKPLSKKSKVIKKLFNYNPNELAHTKSVILSSVLALRESVNLFARRAIEIGKRGPDFAFYDCYGCHHDLQLPSWRQERGYRGKAGHPQMRDWPETLVKLGIIYATNDNRSYLEKKKEYRAKLKKLYDALNARLFGDPKQIGNPESKNTASGELIAWLDSLISEISGSRYDHTAAVQSLRRLWTLREPNDPDYYAYPAYDDARQIAWATISIYRDLKPKPDKDKEINQIFNKLGTALHLDLETYPKALKASADYDPKWFKEQLDKLSKMLPQ